MATVFSSPRLGLGAVVGCAAVLLLPVAPLPANVVLPNLPAGSRYQIAFVTAGSRDATSGDIADYNTFVAEQAAENSSLQAALRVSLTPVAWRAIASTATTNAMDNAPSSYSTPIYNTAGLLVASGTTDLWGGMLQHPINHDQFGQYFYTYPYTGTTDEGVGTETRCLGAAGPAVGSDSAQNSAWVSFGYQDPNTRLLPFYGLSTPITVPVPGDANLDGRVDINDLSVVLINYDHTAGMSWATGDFNGDGHVDINDLNAILANYDHSVAAVGARVSAVPEPSVAAVIASAAAALLVCARRRRP